MFNVARIPEPHCDTLSKPPDLSSQAARSIFLMVHDWCYSVTVYHPPASKSEPPRLLSPGLIEARLRAVVLDVEARLSIGEKPLPVGILSADDRDRWAENLQYLLSLSPVNQKSYQAMCHSAMGLSLDHTTYNIVPTPSSSNLPPSRIHPRTPSESSIDSHLHAIRGTTQNISNRFYDKAFTLIIDPSTRAGASGEHSPVDALVPSIVSEYGLVEGVDAEAFRTVELEENLLDGQGWERLEWVGDAKIKKECQLAMESAKVIVEDSDDRNYKLSPDAFIQMALQLAWYRYRGEFTATYETVLTRLFKHGRTETLRVFSRESRLWVLSMVDMKTSDAERFVLLQKAIASHTRRTREAMTGRGFDRHLLGLRLLLRPLNAESAALFEDELFERSSRWKLSTSGLSAGMLFKGTGFGTVYEDGFGINYLAAPDMVKFGIESKFSNPSTSTQAFKHAVDCAMKDMYTLCQTVELKDNQRNVLSHL
ncbi:Carnitine O-palmitoyltransferase 1, liver isoform [Psilocybe cubensis]|nr:Carnitine O-palmitoyltransferase 1, liver isoform [Psilocybe cubensis]KAH9481600.1 Carnitine O-palmitoyltransferase 1, liver isoform [Psilocybe cubensis]